MSNTVAILGSASSANIALGKTAPGGQFQASGTADVYNSGAADVAVNFGSSSVAAVMPAVGTPGAYVIPKGQIVRGLPVLAGADHVAVIGVGLVYITPNF